MEGVIVVMNDTRAASGRPSDTTLAELPARVLVFLSAIATRPAIRGAMGEAGFRAADHAEGCRLLLAVAELTPTAVMRPRRSEAISAMAELHAFATSNFRRFRAALERLHPESSYLFPELDSRYPGESLLAVAKLLQRIPACDAKVLGTLGQRGLDGAELQRLSRLVTEAQRLDTGADAQPDAEERTEELTALYHWHKDWIESAKSVIRRKDWRLSLGIGGRGSSRGLEVVDDGGQADVRARAQSRSK
jgi:hypothetical protein